MNDLKAAILTKLGEPLDVLNKLQVEQEDRYRTSPLQFWQEVAANASEQARQTKTFYDTYSVKDAATNDVITAVMNHLDSVFRHAERMIVIFSKGRNKN